MSLSRTALRLAAVEALCPSAALTAGGPYPTLAMDRVDDSRVDLLATAQSPQDVDAVLAALENKPLLVVYTEEQHSAPYGEVKYDAAQNVVTLVVEAMIAAKGTIAVGENPDGTPIEIGTLDAPVTDRQHEAILDALESQVRALLDKTASPPRPSSELYRKVAWEIHEIHSTPQRDASRSLRLASRTIKFHVKIAQERWPASGDPAASTGLPSPLSIVAAALPAGSSGAAVCAAIAASLSSPPPVPQPSPAGGIFIQATIDRLRANAPADVVAFVPSTPQP